MEGQTSAEKIKQLVEREGKAARNLVTWSVPVSSSEKREDIRVSAVSGGGSNHSNSRHINARKRDKRGKSYRQQGKSFLPLVAPVNAKASAQAVHNIGHAHSQIPLSEREEICEYYCSNSQRQSRSSKSPSRLDLHARYWAYLFDNLHRAVDEIYKTCEVDNSIVECQEVIMTLEVCRKDFEALIRRIQLFEQPDLQTKSSNIAWEVRKTTSPGKPRSLSSHQATPSPPPPSPLFPPTSKPHPSLNPLTVPGKKRQPQKAAALAAVTQDSKVPPSPSISSSKSGSRPNSARSLDFSTVGKLKLANYDTSKKSGAGVPPEGKVRSPTWADRVKGITKPHPPVTEGKKESERRVSNGAMDEDGWETVSRGRVRSAGAIAGRGRPTRGRNSSKPVEPSSKPGELSSKPEELSSKPGEPSSKPEEPSSKPEELSSKPGELVTAEAHPGQQASSNQPSPTDENGRQCETAAAQNGSSNRASPTVGTGHSVESAGGDREKPAESGSPELPSRNGGDAQQGNAEPADVIEQQTEQNSERGVAEPDQEPTTESGKEDVEEADNDTWTWNDALAMYDATEAYRAEKSWADRCDSPPGGLSDVPRSPGHAIHLHQRLSSPSRKRPVELEESRRMQEEKQAKAQLQRSKLQEEKTLKSRVEADKIREARESRDALARHRRVVLEDKLQRAEMLRESHLQERIRRAQEEEAKVSEISFINTLEAQNRKIEVQERYQGRKARLQELLDERQRKREEQLAKEEAAQERRRTKEAERVAKLMELDQRRRDQELKVEQMLQERERVREETAKEKAKERERKLLARNAALLTSTEELGRKIQLKHDESSKRYDQQLEQKKLVATGVISSRHTSAEQPPKVEAYKTKKWCSICHVEIISEVYLLSHLRGKKHQAAVASADPALASPAPLELVVADSVIVDATEEHQGPPEEQPEIQQRVQAGKKKARKLRQRMSNRWKEIERNKSGGVKAQSANRTKFQRALREVNRQVESAGGGRSGCSRLQLSGSQLQQVDRALGEISRSLGSGDDQACFCQLGGVASVLKMLMLSVENCMGSGEEWSLPQKTFSLALTVLLNCCASRADNCRYLIASNKVVPLADLALLVVSRALTSRQQELALAGSQELLAGTLCSTALCGPLLRLLASVIQEASLISVQARAGEEDALLLQQTTDAISYMVSIGLVDRLGDYFITITGPIKESAAIQLVLGGLNLLVASTAFLHTRVVDVFADKPSDDPTLLTVVFMQTELVGLMQLLYAVLLSAGPPRHSHSPPLLNQHTQAISIATIKTLNNAAILDLKMVQTCLGAEGISLEFRHIVSYLLWYCSHYENANLLHELILAVGYFCVLNSDNQVYLQSGRNPTLLQLLCGLPFEYFSNSKLSQLLYPSLIAACYQMEENKAILEEEISSKLLVAFLQEAIREEKQRARKEEGEGGKGCVLDLSSELQCRFPRAHWEPAITYFSPSLSSQSSP